MEAHWISQKLQFVTESHMSRHCAIQSLQQSKISWNIKYNDAQLQKEGRELIHQICDLHRKVILIPWVRRKKQPEKSNTFKCWVMPWIIQQGPELWPNLSGHTFRKEIPRCTHQGGDSFKVLLSYFPALRPHVSLEMSLYQCIIQRPPLHIK